MARARILLEDVTKVIVIPAEGVQITAESDALTAGVATWLDVQQWNFYPPRIGARVGDAIRVESYSKMELKIRADAAETITSPKLYSVESEPVTIADDTFTSSGSSAVNTVPTIAPRE